MFGAIWLQEALDLTQEDLVPHYRIIPNPGGRSDFFQDS